MLKNQIISLLTDFGITDGYIGAIKGVIMGICPTATLVDITHEIPKYNILKGAFILAQAAPYFPKGSIHVVVVDPGVGTLRRKIIIKGRLHFYVGPDNGVLSLAVEAEGKIKAVEIKNENFMLRQPSKTFDGRDVFAPVAAHLANGVDINEFGPEIHNLTRFSIGVPEKRDEKLIANVIYIDSFGNLTTNISKKMLDDGTERGSIKITIGNISTETPFCNTYGEAPAGSPLLTLGSSGFLEVAVNQGSAKTLFKAKVQDTVMLSMLR